MYSLAQDSSYIDDMFLLAHMAVCFTHIIVDNVLPKRSSEFQECSQMVDIYHVYIYIYIYIFFS